MISIITSLYKSERYLIRYQRYLLRVLNYLKRRNIRNEVIILANEPNEIEKEILNSILKTGYDIKITYVKYETLYASWNRGVQMSSGRAITFWNVDDIRFGKALINGYKKILNGGDVIYFPFIIISRYKYFKYIPIPKIYLDYPKKFNRELFRTGMFCGPFFMASRSAFDNIGLFDEQFRIAADMEWCIRAADKNQVFKYDLAIAGLFIRHGNTLSGNRRSNLQEIENQVIYRRYNILFKYKEINEKDYRMFNNYHIY